MIRGERPGPPLANGLPERRNYVYRGAKPLTEAERAEQAPARAVQRAMAPRPHVFARPQR